MVLSLLVKRMTLGTTVSVAARTAHPARFSIITRRTLFATPQSSSPPAKASQMTDEENTRKIAEKKATKGKRATLVKRGRPPKKIAEHQRKQPKPEKQRGMHALYHASLKLIVC